MRKEVVLRKKDIEINELKMNMLNMNKWDLYRQQRGNMIDIYCKLRKR